MYVPLLGLAARAVISSLTTGSTSGFPASSASPTQSATYASIQPSQEATILALSPATSPPTSAMLVDPSFVNLAFEFGAMPDYTCSEYRDSSAIQCQSNASTDDPESGDYSLNTFSANLIDNIFGLQSGGVPIIRIGGTTGLVKQLRRSPQEDHSHTPGTSPRMTHPKVNLSSQLISWVRHSLLRMTQRGRISSTS